MTKEQRKIYNTNYSRAHKEQKKINNRRYYARHAQEIKDKNAEKKQQRRAYMHAYYLAHKKQLKDYNREYKKKEKFEREYKGVIPDEPKTEPLILPEIKKTAYNPKTAYCANFRVGYNVCIGCAENNERMYRACGKKVKA